MSKRIKVIQCGLGAVGSEAVRIMLEKKNLEITAAIDVSEQMVGKDLGRVIGLDRELGITVCRDADEVFRTVKADVVLLSTTGYFKDIFNTIKAALETGKNVITVGEEAAYPWTKSPDLARQIDELAKKKRVTLLGTGTNPGFMMDYLPIVLTGLMKRVDKISIHRIVDMVPCGLISWQEFGYGKKIEAFNAELAKGRIQAFTTLREIMDITARSLGWEIDDYKESRRALVSKSRRVARSGVVEPGTICGFEQIAHGFRQGKEVLFYLYALIISPNFEEDGMEVGHSISIEGAPDVQCTITIKESSYLLVAARAVNSIPQVIKARPGIAVIYELPPSPCF